MDGEERQKAVQYLENFQAQRVTNQQQKMIQEILEKNFNEKINMSTNYSLVRNKIPILEELGKLIEGKKILFLNCYVCNDLKPDDYEVIYTKTLHSPNYPLMDYLMKGYYQIDNKIRFIEEEEKINKIIKNFDIIFCPYNCNMGEEIKRINFKLLEMGKFKTLNKKILKIDEIKKENNGSNKIEEKLFKNKILGDLIIKKPITTNQQIIRKISTKVYEKEAINERGNDMYDQKIIYSPFYIEVDQEEKYKEGLCVYNTLLNYFEKKIKLNGFFKTQKLEEVMDYLKNMYPCYLTWSEYHEGIEIEELGEFFLQLNKLPTIIFYYKDKLNILYTESDFEIYLNQKHIELYTGQLLAKVNITEKQHNYIKKIYNMKLYKLNYLIKVLTPIIILKKFDVLNELLYVYYKHKKYKDIIWELDNKIINNKVYERGKNNRIKFKKRVGKLKKLLKEKKLQASKNDKANGYPDNINGNNVQDIHPNIKLQKVAEKIKIEEIKNKIDYVNNSLLYEFRKKKGKIKINYETRKFE